MIYIIRCSWNNISTVLFFIYFGTVLAIRILVLTDKSSTTMFIKILPLFIALGFFVAKGPSSADFEYVGSAKCKMCHNSPTKGAQYKIWADSPHAKAMESLKGDEKKDPKCLKCHSTAGHTDKKLQLSLTVEEGVGCESCHGPGSAYKSNTIMKDRAKAIAKGMTVPTEKTCRKCHNEESPNFKGFDFKKYFAEIAHPRPKVD